MMILVTVLMRVRAHLFLEATHDTLGSQVALSVGPSSTGDIFPIPRYIFPHRRVAIDPSVSVTPNILDTRLMNNLNKHPC